MPTSLSLLAQRLAIIKALMEQLEANGEAVLGPEHVPTLLRLRAELDAAPRHDKRAGPREFRRRPRTAAQLDRAESALSHRRPTGHLAWSLAPHRLALASRPPADSTPRTRRRQRLTR